MKGIVRTLALTGIVAAAAIAGQAQAQVGIAVQVGPNGYYYSSYVPPSPGPDFYWTPGYYAGAVWVPGRWIHRDHYYVHDWDDHYYHHDWDHYRHDHDYDHDHGYHRGWDNDRH